jgi:hypothetical protein
METTLPSLTSAAAPSGREILLRRTWPRTAAPPLRRKAPTQPRGRVRRARKQLPSRLRSGPSVDQMTRPSPPDVREAHRCWKTPSLTVPPDLPTSASHTVPCTGRSTRPHTRITRSRRRRGRTGWMAWIGRQSGADGLRHRSSGIARARRTPATRRVRVAGTRSSRSGCRRLWPRIRTARIRPTRI